MAVTKRGQLLKININHPIDLPERGEDNLDIVIGNRGVNSVKDVLVDVEIPPQLVVLDRDPRARRDHVARSRLERLSLHAGQPAAGRGFDDPLQSAHIVRHDVARAAASKATAWQRDLPGDKLVETAVIKLRP